MSSKNRTLMEFCIIKCDKNFTNIYDVDFSKICRCKIFKECKLFGYSGIRHPRYHIFYVCYFKYPAIWCDICKP